MEYTKVWLHMGANEYSTNTPMEKLAAEHAYSFSERPLLVEVIEHGGWFESYYFDEKHPQGIRVATANDMGKYYGEAQMIRERLYNATIKYHPSRHSTRRI